MNYVIARSLMSARRQGRVVRKTNETDVQVFLDLDCHPGSGVAQEIDIHTGIGFLDHVCVISSSFNRQANSAHHSLDVPRTSEARRVVLANEVLW